MHDLDVKHHNHALQSKLARLYTLRQGSRVHWDRALYLKLLEDLGQDYKKLPPIIHVAGTNGKGSIIAILRAICEAQGMRVHAYTSPHLITVNERIYLAGADISDDYLVQLIDDVMGYVGAMPLSFFEVMTALAFRAFAQVPADILLLEVGCGGRLDCTNVIDAPLATCISRISRDHTEYLGEGVCEIAAEKAGIMKRGVPCVIGRQGDSKSAAKIIEVCCDAAQDVGADALVFGRDWRVDKKDNMLHFNFKGEVAQYPAPNLFGAHQIWNAGGALAVIKSVQDKLKISDAAIATGLTSIYWPGRMQQLKAQDFGLGAGDALWLDCAHNDSAGEILAQQIKDWAGQDEQQDRRPVYIIAGMLGKKDMVSFFAPFLPYVKCVYIIPIAGEAGCKTAAELNEYFKDQAYDIQDSASLQEALGLITGSERGQKRIIICGSVYLAGAVLGKMM